MIGSSFVSFQGSPRSSKKRSSRRARSAGFTLVELLVVIAVIAVLVLLMLPAINAAREAARMTSCKNNIRQLGIALIGLNEAQGTLPAGWTGTAPEEGPGWGWGSKILPFIEQGAVYESIDPHVSIADPKHEFARSRSISVFMCPTDFTKSVFEIGEDDGADHDHDHGDHGDGDGDDHGHDHAGEPLDFHGPFLFPVARSNYAGVFGTTEIEDAPGAGDGVLYFNSRTQFRDITDGLSNTMLIGERSSRLGASVWVGMIPGAREPMVRFVGSTDHTPNHTDGHFEDFSSYHLTGAHFVMGDGATRLIADKVDAEVYRGLATRSGAEIVNPD